MGRGTLPLLVNGHALDPIHERIAAEVFLTTVAPSLVREAATILAARNVPVMPLKGVLLQQLIYKNGVFREMRDVDLLVPPALFPQACLAFREAGFEAVAVGLDSFRRPGHILEIDLHRRLSATTRSRLRADDMFRRGRSDTQIFGVSVVLPSPEDLYAHLLLHLALHWIRTGRLHHPEDFEAVPEALALSVDGMARHLAEVGLIPHAALMLPLVAAHSGGDFTIRLLRAVRLSTRHELVTSIGRALCERFAPGSLQRRTAGFLLAPSWTEASVDALMNRLNR